MIRATPSGAGRIVGTAREAWAAFRATDPCCRCGEAIGEAIGYACQPVEVGGLAKLEVLGLCERCHAVVAAALRRVGT